jgi:hypothetical protein
MTRVRVLVFCADDDLRCEIKHTTTRLAGSPTVTRKCVRAMPTQGQLETVFPVLGPCATSVDVLVGVADLRMTPADGVLPMVDWLSSVEADVWRVALVVAGHQQEHVDHRARDLLRTVDVCIPGQPVSVHLTWTLSIRRAFLGALSAVLTRVASVSPSPVIAPRSPQAEEACQWTVDIIVSGDGLLAHALGGLGAIQWQAMPSVCAHRVGDVTLTDPAAAGERYEPADWAYDPETPTWWQNAHAGAVLAVAELAPNGAMPDHFVARLAERPDLYPSTALCLILPAGVGAGLANLLMAEQWLRLGAGAGPRVCVHLSAAADLLYVWHTLARVSPAISHPFDVDDTLWPESPDL